MTKCFTRGRFVPEAPFGGAEGGVDEGVVRLQRDRFMEVAERGVAVVALERVTAAREQPSRLVGIELDRGIEQGVGAGAIAVEVWRRSLRFHIAEALFGSTRSAFVEGRERFVVAVSFAEDDDLRC